MADIKTKCQIYNARGYENTWEECFKWLVKVKDLTPQELRKHFKVHIEEIEEGVFEWCWIYSGRKVITW